MSKRIKLIVLQVALPLVVGLMIYTTLRAQPPFSQFIPWDTPVFMLNFLPRFLYVFIVFRLPGMLWTFSFISATDAILKNSLLSASIVLSIFISYEYLQYEGVIRGTGDVGDIFYSLITVILYIIIFGGKRNEKKP